MGEMAGETGEHKIIPGGVISEKSARFCAAGCWLLTEKAGPGYNSPRNYRKGNRVWHWNCS